jgi:hypothetical protein
MGRSFFECNQDRQRYTAFEFLFFVEKFVNKLNAVPGSEFSNHRDDGAGDKNQEFSTQNSYKIEVWENECNVSVKTTLVLNLSFLRSH